MSAFAPGQLTARQADLLNDLLRWRDAFDRLAVAAPLSISRVGGIPAISTGALADAVLLADPTEPPPEDSVPTFDTGGDLQNTPLYVTQDPVNGSPAAQVTQYTADNPTSSTPALQFQAAADGDGAGTAVGSISWYPAGTGSAVGGTLNVYQSGGDDYWSLTADTYLLTLSLFDLTGVTEVDFTGVTITGFAGGGTRTEGTAAADGSTQSDATQLTDDTTVVSGADGTKGVKLKNSAAGIIAVENTTASTLKVYPPTGAQISALGTNTAYSQLGNEKRAYWRFSSTQWYTSLLS